MKNEKDWPFESKPRLKNEKNCRLRVSPDENKKDWPFDSKPRLKDENDWPLRVSPD